MYLIGDIGNTETKICLLDLNSKSGYILVLPMNNQVLQLQTNMSGTLNIDWLSSVTLDLFRDFSSPFLSSVIVIAQYHRTKDDLT